MTRPAAEIVVTVTGVLDSVSADLRRVVDKEVQFTLKEGRKVAMAVTASIQYVFHPEEA